MLPDPALLVDVLPAGELAANGRPAGALRRRLRRTHDARNVFNVASVWLQSFGVIGLALWLSNPLAWAAAFLLMGRAFALFAILTHEAAHRLLFSNRGVNDFVGRWLLGYPAFLPLDLYRRSHNAHHRDELGPDEPDLGLYLGYPISRDSWHRKLSRDALFVSGWKNLRALLMAFKSPIGRPVATRIALTQAVIFAVFSILGYPLAWPLLWLAPWMTVWRVLNRLRAIAEHGGAERSEDRRLTTHHARQSLLARFWIVPFNTGYHLAHHVDVAVPFQNLPRLHAELERAGWIQPGLAFPSYRALWRTASSGAAQPALSSGGPGG
ncbi:MAG: hypothetical protein JJLCMIEE_03339 [Acidimicrobiales bacterium]|nr:MAG: hypothetical protein EDR02_16805 [Actinomycetota bacterium]MBV6510209.1 hypothetical protein [Acidimicrobiales bacterium]RIK03534.1 MAG: hypothetical protein DCC48_16460 [Acidobacteriota bacterium]